MTRGKLLSTGAALAALAVSACATVGSTPNAPAVAQGERQRAAQQHEQILQQFGGAWTGPQAAYVSRVGDRVATAAGLPGQCTFTVVNSDVVNAFAVPGCYIYVTRGLLALANSEAELAYVLGHEVGHVTAAHSQKRQNASILTGLGALAVGILTGSGDLAQLAGQGAQLYTLRYSREQEFESDDLGVRYMVQSGYDPYAAADMLGALSEHDRLQSVVRSRDAKSTPEWARSHPLTENRISRAAEQARGTGVGPDALPEQEGPYLSALDGMIYADDPTQGYIEGRTFAHPTLRVAFDAPAGFTLANSPRAVLVEGESGAKAQFSGGRMTSSSLEQHAEGVLRQLLGQTPAQVGAPRRTTTNGLETVVLPARAQTRSGVVDVTVVAYRFGPETAYHFVSLAPAGQAGALEPLFRSVRRLSDSEAAALRPRVIQVVTAARGDTVQSLAARMAYPDYRLERFLALNGLRAGEALQPGRRLKLVVYGRAG